MKIGIANDHRGYNLKNELVKYLKSRGYEVIDYGSDTVYSVDYPDFAFKVGEKVSSKEADFGILICKSGIGMSIAANKVKGVRCALLDNVKNATLSHMHNNANVIALGSNDVSIRKAYQIIKAYDDATFETRHQKRIDKITQYENK